MPPNELPAELADRFRIVERFRGGEGWSGRVVGEAGEVFLKCLPPPHPPLEAATLSRIRHPAFPLVHEAGSTADGSAYILRDFVAGRPLSEVAPLQPGIARTFAVDLLDALAHLHSLGILHLDLKPANLLLHPSRSPSCTVLDFGMSRELGETGGGGTPIFCSPEQRLGLPVDYRSDLFSLGVLLFVTVMGSEALPTSRFMKLFPSQPFFEACDFDPARLPLEFRRLLPRLLRRRPAERPFDAVEAQTLLAEGRVEPARHRRLLLPDPIATHGPAILAEIQASDCRSDLVLVADNAGDAGALATHLACSLGDVRAVREVGVGWHLDRGGEVRQEIRVPPIDAQGLARHLERVVDLPTEQARDGARWILDQPEPPATVMEALVESGALVPQGLLWAWPDAAARRLPREVEAAERPDPAAIRAVARSGQIARAELLFGRALSEESHAEPELRSALAAGLLECGEARRALPWTTHDPALRARALLDLRRVDDARAVLPDDIPHDRDLERTLAELALAAGDVTEARRRIEPLLSDDDPRSLMAGAPILAAAGDRDRAEALVRRSLDVLGEDAPYLRAVALNNLAVQRRAAGALDEAEKMFRDARDAFLQLAHVHHAATASLNLGVTAKDLNRLDTAIAELRRSRSLFESIEDDAGIALTIGAEGIAAVQRGDPTTATELLADAIRRLDNLGAHEHVPRLTEVLQSLALDSKATTLETLDQEAGSPASPMTPHPISRERFRAFVAVNRRLAAGSDLRAAMTHLLETAITLTGGRRGYLLLEHGSGLQLECDVGEADATRRALSRSMVNRAVQEQRTMTAQEAIQDGDLLEMPSVRDLQQRSAICAPFVTSSGARGAIYVEHAGRQGVFHDGDKEDLEVLADQAAIAAERLLAEQALRERLETTERELSVLKRRARQPRSLLGKSPAMQRLNEQIHRFATSDLSILIRGETGSGKELVAHALHDQSARREGPFVAENCSALAPELLDAELFGHARGAFTGAEQDRAGLLELASTGTLFLDEVGDMPPELQAKLLRALQEGVIRRVGGNDSIPVDLRVVAATHKDLREMCATGSFREDLYYRLAAAEIEVPPLRERGEDVRLLAEHFLERHNRDHARSKKFSAAATAALSGYAWPGNVRELEHIVARAYLLNDDTIQDIGLPSSAPQVVDAPTAPMTLREAEGRAIRAALEATGGDKTKAAKALGISRTALYDKLRRQDASTDPDA